MTEDDEREQDAKVAKLIAGGGDVVGSVSSAAVGFAIAGPPGALVGAIMGPVISHAAAEFADRYLSGQERKRVGAVSAIAIQHLHELQEQGHSLRSDNFFDLRVNGTSDAAEVVEAILIAAQREPQERKIQFLGYMQARIAVDPSIDAATASWLVKTAEELTWKQFVILSLVGREPRDIPDTNMHLPGASDWTSWGVREQWQELGWGRRGLIAPGQEESQSDAEAAASGWKTKLPPRIKDAASSFKLANGGRLLFTLLGLEEMPETDLALLREELRVMHLQDEAPIVTPS